MGAYYQIVPAIYERNHAAEALARAHDSGDAAAVSHARDRLDAAEQDLDECKAAAVAHAETAPARPDSPERLQELLDQARAALDARRADPATDDDLDDDADDDSYCR